MMSMFRPHNTFVMIYMSADWAYQHKIKLCSILTEKAAAWEALKNPLWGKKSKSQAVMLDKAMVNPGGCTPTYQINLQTCYTRWDCWRVHESDWSKYIRNPRYIDQSLFWEYRIRYRCQYKMREVQFLTRIYIICFPGMLSNIDLCW